MYIAANLCGLISALFYWYSNFRKTKKDMVKELSQNKVFTLFCDLVPQEYLEALHFKAFWDSFRDLEQMDI